MTDPRTSIRGEQPPKGPTDRETQEALGDAEFEIAVAEQMGPYGREALDASKAHVMGGGKSFNYRGLYWPGDEPQVFPPSEHFDEPWVMQPDSVNAIGTPQAQNDIWAHEFRHRAFVQDDYDDKSRIDQEKWNQWWDYWRADSPEEYEKILDRYQSYLLDRRIVDSISLADTDKRLRAIIERNWKGHFTQMEAEAGMEQGTAVPYRGIMGMIYKAVGWEMLARRNEIELEQMRHKAMRDQVVGTWVLQEKNSARSGKIQRAD